MAFINIRPSGSLSIKLHLQTYNLANRKLGVENTDSNDPELDKLLAELEKDGEESKPLVEKQIKKAKDELYDVGEKEIKDDDDETSEDYWS